MVVIISDIGKKEKKIPYAEKFINTDMNTDYRRLSW